MKILTYYIFLFSFLVSCKSVETGVLISDHLEYDNKEGYKNLYIVDTIKIENPVRIFTKKGYQFVMSRKTFDLFDGKEELLFGYKDVFLLEHGLPMQLPPYIFSKYAKGSDCSEYSKLEQTQKGGINTVYSYTREPDYFLLLLIRNDYYNQVYAGIDGPPRVSFEKDEVVYYKVVIPRCVE